MQPARNVAKKAEPLDGSVAERPDLFIERRAERRAPARPAAASATGRTRMWIGLTLTGTAALAGIVATSGTITVLLVLLGVAVTQLAGLVMLGRRAGRMDRLAHRDELTSLGNARALWQDFEALLKTSGVALAVIDLDHFKAINDEYGHGVGDAVLRAVGTTLPLVAGPEARCYRYGGEELVVLLPGADEQTAAAMAERVRARVAQGFDGLPELTLSAGVTAAMAGAPSRSVFDRADDALRRAKLSGRNRVVLATSLDDISESDDTSTLAARRAALAIAMAALEARDADTADHSDDVVLLCEAIAERLDITGDEREHLLAAARLHDIGKVAVPNEILEKPGPLDETEWEIMRQHTLTGERILRSVPELEDIAPIVRSAHERYDGKGYPDGLAGEAIPLASRVILCSDAFHAIRSDRPYRKSRSPEVAAREIAENAGTQFDPIVAGTLLEVVRDANRPGRPRRTVRGISPRLTALLVAAAATGTAVAAVPPLRDIVERITKQSKPPVLAPSAPVSGGSQGGSGGAVERLQDPAGRTAPSSPGQDRRDANRRNGAGPRPNATPGRRGPGPLAAAVGAPALVPTGEGAADPISGAPESSRPTSQDNDEPPGGGSPEPTADAPASGQSQDAPGQGGASPGQSENAPGQGESSPGNSDNAPGHSDASPGNSDNAPGNSGNAPGQGGSSPGNSGDAPGNSDEPPGNSGNAPGQGDEPPGNSGNAPGQGGSSPGNSGNAPGHSQAPQGQGNGKD